MSIRWLFSISIEPPATDKAITKASSLGIIAKHLCFAAAQHRLASFAAMQYAGLLIIVAAIARKQRQAVFSGLRLRRCLLDGAAAASHTLFRALPND